MDNKKAVEASDTRRRGETLEDALLTAAREELAEVGYNRLSMKGVAERAKTSRSVLSRRWNSRVEMVLSVMRMNGSLFTDAPADTGSLREDMLALLRQFIKRFHEIGADVVLGIMTDCLSGAAAPFDLQENMMAANLAHTKIIVERAVKRDEAHDNIPDHVLAVPMELLRAKLLIGGEPDGDAFLYQIVDDVFMPLVGKTKISKLK